MAAAEAEAEVVTALATAVTRAIGCDSVNGSADNNQQSGGGSVWQ